MGLLGFVLLCCDLVSFNSVIGSYICRKMCIQDHSVGVFQISVVKWTGLVVLYRLTKFGEWVPPRTGKLMSLRRVCGIDSGVMLPRSRIARILVPGPETIVWDLIVLFPTVHVSLVSSLLMSSKMRCAGDDARVGRQSVVHRSRPVEHIFSLGRDMRYGADLCGKTRCPVGAKTSGMRALALLAHMGCNRCDAISEVLLAE